jgi:tetratricopeptide (TPR) repeat protein
MGLAALCLALSAGTAAAQEKEKGKDANKAAAKEHYQRGTSLYDLGHYPEAIKEFEAAYELKNDPAFLYNLAQSYRQAGDAEQALHFYRTYLRYVPKPPNKAEIEERIAALEKQVAEKGPGTGATQPPSGGTGPGGGATTPPPGGGEPNVTGSGPVPPGGAGTTPPGGTPPPSGTTTTPTPPAGGPPPPPPPGGAPPPAFVTAPSQPAPVYDAGKKYQTAGLVMAGVGGVMLIIGIVEGSRAKSAANEINNEAATGMPYDSSVQQRGKSAQTAEAWLITLGVLAGAGGAGLWYYGHRVSAETTANATYKFSFAPVLAPNGGGALLRVRF